MLKDVEAGRGPRFLVKILISNKTDADEKRENGIICLLGAWLCYLLTGGA
jgi:hypothetical protein